MSNSKTFDYLQSWAHKGIICRVMGGPFSNYNGYVGVPKTNPAWGKSYSELYEQGKNIDVPGGLTFSEQGKVNSMHWPDPELWWFGFDTSHSGDAIDYGYGDGREKQGHFWTAEEVAKEVQSMAEQFANLQTLESQSTEGQK